jgi:hypothetical protein
MRECTKEFTAENTGRDDDDDDDDDTIIGNDAAAGDGYDGDTRQMRRATTKRGKKNVQYLYTRNLSNRKNMPTQ